MKILPSIAGTTLTVTALIFGLTMVPSRAQVGSFLPTWEQEINTPQQDNGEDVAVDSQDNVYFSGYTYGNLAAANVGGEDIFLAKYDTNGNSVWSIQLGTSRDDDAEGVAVDRQDHVIVAGYTGGKLSKEAYYGTTDCFLAKYKSNGKLLWSTQMGTPQRENYEDIAIDQRNNIWAVGHTQGSLAATNAGSDDIVLVKYNANGKVLWMRQFGTSASDLAKDVIVDRAGNGYVVGHTQGSLAAANQGDYDRILAKYDTNGNQLWLVQSGTTGVDLSEGVNVDSTGFVYTVGTYSPTFGDGDGYLAKYRASDGSQQWFSPIGTVGSADSLKDITLDVTGKIYVAGYTEGSLGATNIGSDDGFIAQFTNGGLLLSVQQYGTLGSDTFKGLRQDSLGNLFTGGYVIPVDGDNQAWVYKFSPF